MQNEFTPIFQNCFACSFAVGARIVYPPWRNERSPRKPQCLEGWQQIAAFFGRPVSSRAAMAVHGMPDKLPERYVPSSREELNLVRSRIVRGACSDRNRRDRPQRRTETRIPFRAETRRQETSGRKPRYPLGLNFCYGIQGRGVGVANPEIANLDNFGYHPATEPSRTPHEK